MQIVKYITDVCLFVTLFAVTLYLVEVTSKITTKRRIKRERELYESLYGDKSKNEKY